MTLESITAMEGLKGTPRAAGTMEEDTFMLDSLGSQRKEKGPTGWTPGEQREERKEEWLQNTHFYRHEMH